MKTRERPVEIEVKLSLPSSVAREAEESGLLEPDRLEGLLRDALRRRRIEGLFAAADRLASVPLPSLTESEVAAEIRAARDQRRRPHAGGR